MIRIVAEIILLAFVSQAQVEELVEKHSDELVNKILNKLGSRVSAGPPDEAELDSTTLAKEVETTTPAPQKFLGFTKSAGVWPPKLTFKGALDSPGTWPLKPGPSISSTWQTKPGDFSCTLKTTDGPFLTDGSSKRTRSLSVEKTIGSVCCALDSPVDWPAKVTPSIKGKVDSPGGSSICYDLKTPVSWPLEAPKPTGSISLEKKFGSTSTALKTSPSWPLKPTASISHTLKGKGGSGSICFGLNGPATWPLKPTASIKSTVDTKPFSLTYALESNLVGDLKPTGSVTLKKKIGSVCCSLVAKKPGSIQCTFESTVGGK